jgi:hypothetical protein
MANKYVLGYLILAHQYPEQLARLINVLSNDEVVFFIHIDKKTDIAAFKALIPESEQVMYVKNRVKVYWMGYSTITATMALMETALLYRLSCQYYTLLSGVDYPIKSNEYILNFFRGSSSQFIKTFSFEDQPVWYPKIEKYHYLDNGILNRRGRLAKDYHHIHAFLTSLYLFVQRFLPDRCFVSDLVPYGGSQFWSLTSDCLSYTYSFLRANGELARFYALTDGPDEMIFHTIIMNSHFSHKIKELKREQFWDDCPNLIIEYGNNFRYIDWSVRRERPAILQVEDFDRLKASDDLFARKFDPIKSNALLEKIDQLIKSKNESGRISV